MREKVIISVKLRLKQRKERAKVFNEAREYWFMSSVQGGKKSEQKIYIGFSCVLFCFGFFWWGRSGLFV